MKTILLVFGTRPEAVKMCPLVRELKSREQVDTVVCVTGQHDELLAPVLRAFSVTPDYDLGVMRPEQSLFDVTTLVLQRLRPVLEKVRPDVLLVHGDTTTTFAAALAGYYERVPVGHVEAGLRTYDAQRPFPEEFDRRAVSIVSRYHFAPTRQAAQNLLREGVDPARVFVTGNTVVDALRTTVREDFRHPVLDWAAGSRLVLITAHRRENLGGPMREMFRVIRQAVDRRPDVKAVYPVHMNPAVRAAAEEALGGHERIRLIEPLDVVDFHNIMRRSYLVLTDSGGVQEEASSLGVPTLVMRDVTERPEGIAAGTLRLAGTREQTVRRELDRLLDDPAAYGAMARAEDPYGDGQACRRIADVLCGPHESGEEGRSCGEHHRDP